MGKANPYQSPTVETSTPPEDRRPVFRWRVLPTVFMALYGVGLVLPGVVALLSLPVMYFVAPERLTMTSILGGFLAVTVGIPAGLLACAVARWWWQVRWRRAVIGSLTFGLLYGTMALLASLLGIH